MKRLLFIGVIIFCFTKICSQEELKECCDAKIFLDIHYTDSIPLYEHQKGQIITFLKHNLEDENFVQFKIEGRDSTMFYVYVYVSQDEDKIVQKGWIEKNEHLGIFSRAYNSNLILYKNPTKKSQMIIQYEYNSKMYEVIDCNGNWLKIRTFINKKYYEGWIPLEM